MTDYSRLIEELRRMAKASAFLSTLMPAAENGMTKLLNDAADAIEELQAERRSECESRCVHL